MGGDISVKEDLCIAAMNMISIEEHLFFSAAKTGKFYSEVFDEIREIRKKYMKELIGEPEGEIWCISKHLLATTMRLIETGAKKKGSERASCFSDAARVFSLFWKLNQGKVKVTELENEPKIKKILEKVLECCRE